VPTTPASTSRRLRLLRPGLLGPVLAGAALLGSACAAPSTPEPLPVDQGIPSTTSTKPSCPDSGVTMRAGLTDAAMGVRAFGVQLTNCGTAPYEVNGYPGVRVLDVERQPLPIEVTNGEETDDRTPAPITLQPGDTAVARLLWRSNVTRSDVDAVNGTYVEVTPADGQAPQIVRPDGPIDLGNTGTVNVSAWYVP
jgi:hypothetical protein